MMLLELRVFKAAANISFPQRAVVVWNRPNRRPEVQNELRPNGRSRQMVHSRTLPTGPRIRFRRSTSCTGFSAVWMCAQPFPAPPRPRSPVQVFHLITAKKCGSPLVIVVSIHCTLQAEAVEICRNCLLQVGILVPCTLHDRRRSMLEHPEC